MARGPRPATEAFACALIVLAAPPIAGCASSAPGATVGCDGPAPNIHHVHALAFDPGPGALYVATHHGLVRAAWQGECWRWEMVGNRRDDLMGLTQDPAEPGTLYASGHPEGGGNLGLRRSRDGGVTWEARSLAGEVDFHALAAVGDAPGHVVGFWAGALKESRDGGATWEDRPLGFDPVALAGGGGTVWAATPFGLRKSLDLAYWQPVQDFYQRPVSSVAVSADGSFLLAGTWNGREGSAFRSVDGGQAWTELGEEAIRASRGPLAFTVDPRDAGHAFASALAGTVWETRDRGATWTRIRG